MSFSRGSSFDNGINDLIAQYDSLIMKALMDQYLVGDPYHDKNKLGRNFGMFNHTVHYELRTELKAKADEWKTEEGKRFANLAFGKLLNKIEAACEKQYGNNFWINTNIIKKLHPELVEKTK